jgi:hypothetical protein
VAELINLRMARKQRARAEKEASAQQNRIRHGRTASERNRLGTEQAAAERRLDSHDLGSDRRDGPADAE